VIVVQNKSNYKVDGGVGMEKIYKLVFVDLHNCRKYSIRSNWENIYYMLKMEQGEVDIRILNLIKEG
jgi:hypothetical protein